MVLEENSMHDLFLECLCHNLPMLLENTLYGYHEEEIVCVDMKDN